MVHSEGLYYYVVRLFSVLAKWAILELQNANDYMKIEML